MTIKKLKKNKKGFVLLFAITISSILLAIALGVANIALKEVKFGTNARDTNDAFFAADTGIEYALFRDKDSASYPSSEGQTNTYPDILTNLNSSGSCAIISVEKDGLTSPPSIFTTIISKGYNNGDSSCNPINPDRIERELKVTY